jgi:hypothetical protein
MKISEHYAHLPDIRSTGMIIMAKTKLNRRGVHEVTLLMDVIQKKRSPMHWIFAFSAPGFLLVKKQILASPVLDQRVELLPWSTSSPRLVGRLDTFMLLTAKPETESLSHALCAGVVCFVCASATALRCVCLLEPLWASKLSPVASGEY